MIVELMRSTRHITVGLVISVLTSCSDSTTNPSESPADGPDLAVASNAWVRRANLPNTERLGLASAVVVNSAGESVLYVIGGSSIEFPQPGAQVKGALTRVQAFNPMTNTWTNRKSLPIDLYRSNGAGVIGGKIYLSGGRQSGDKRITSALLVYDPATNTWTRKSDMPFESAGGITGVWQNQLYVLTSGDEDGDFDFNRAALYRYDPPSDTWTTLTVTPVPLGLPMGGFIGGKLYATGGPSGALLAYDPATNTWTTKASLPNRRWLGAGVTLAAKLYILGGLEADATGSGTPVRKTSVYDPATDTWTNAAQIPTARVDFTASRVVVNGQPKIEVVGGPRPGNNLQYTP